MSTILFGDAQGRRNPRPLPPTRCTSWCLHADGHPEAVHPSEQACVSYAHQVDAAQGGGDSADHGISSPGSLSMQVEKQPGQPATIVVGVALMDREFYVRFSAPEFVNALLYGQIALDQARST